MEGTTEERESTMTDDASAPPGSGVTVDGVRDALKQVFDPELGLNIVDLGLVYDVQVDERGDVDIQYTLTTMGCPIGPLIEDQMRAFLAALPGIGEVRPEFVIRPAWTPEMMSDEAKAALGIF
jgi:metal-sulfur cluster biosynthetic enzyme